MCRCHLELVVSELRPVTRASGAGVVHHPRLHAGCRLLRLTVSGLGANGFREQEFAGLLLRNLV